MKAIKMKFEAGTMKKIGFSLILMVVILLSGTQLFGQTKIESEILSLSNNKFRWQAEGKIDSVAYVLDNNVVIVHSDGKIQSKKDFLNDMRRGRNDYNNIEVKGALVRISGTTATLVGKASFVNTMNGDATSYGMTYTEVYSLENNLWKLIANHSTNISN